MASMNVTSMVSLSTPAEERHIKVMRSAANSLTDDRESVRAYICEEEPDAVFADLTVTKARQMDVSDRIMQRFSDDMPDYETQTLWFPKRSKQSCLNNYLPTTSVDAGQDFARKIAFTVLLLARSVKITSVGTFWA
ncbi:MAG: hypothetical protein PHO37_07820 [Kiritimatiellae bacterium]|nr:hypothetical protein [Kiritimatiellia bacterium]